MSSRWKKVWADFWGNKTRTFLVVIAIMVGTAGVGLISDLRLYMIASMDSDYRSANPPEAWIYASPMDEGTIRIASEIPGVKAVEGRSVFTANAVQPSGKITPVEFTAIQDANDLTIGTLAPVKGETSIPPLRSQEVLIEATAASLGYQPGDLITIERSHGRNRELRLAGYVHAPAEIPYSMGGVIKAYVTPETMEWLGGSLGYSTLTLSVADNATDREHVKQVAQAVKERLECGGTNVTGILIFDMPGHHYLYKTLQDVLMLMGSLGWLTALLSAFLIINTTAGLMSQQTRQIGIMKATGGGTAQILGMYIVLILGFGLAALIIAVPLASAGARAIGDLVAQFLGFYTSPYRGYGATLIQQVSVALAIPVLAALWPMYNSVRTTVREALMDYGISKSAGSKKAVVNRNSLVIPRPVRLSLRNAFRRKARLALTLLTLILAGGIFISVFNLWSSFDKMIADLQGYYVADVNVELGRLYRMDQVDSLTKSVPGVAGVEGWLTYAGTFAGKKGEAETTVTFFAPPSTSTLIRPILISGRWLRPSDENAIAVSNSFVQAFPEVKAGDWLTIKIDGKESKWQVIGVLSMPPSTPLFYTNYEYLSHVINEPGQANSLHVITDQHEMATQERISDQLKEVYAGRGIQVSSADSGAKLMQSVTQIFDIFAYCFLAMATLIAVIGGMGLMSTMSINVLERTREIGVLRAIGASSWDIQTIVIVEGIVIGLISWAAGLVLSVPLTGLMASGVGIIVFGTPLQTIYGLTGIFAWLIGVLVLGTIASTLPARSASRLTVKATLAYE